MSLNFATEKFQWGTYVWNILMDRTKSKPDVLYVVWDVHIIAIQRSPIPPPALGKLCYQCGAGRMENVCAMPVSI
jgi:hypothetical protein